MFTLKFMRNLAKKKHFKFSAKLKHIFFSQNSAVFLLPFAKFIFAIAKKFAKNKRQFARMFSFAGNPTADKNKKLCEVFEQIKMSSS